MGADDGDGTMILRKGEGGKKEARMKAEMTGWIAVRERGGEIVAVWGSSGKWRCSEGKRENGTSQGF